MPRWFNTRKAAQVVAFFAREQGGAINVLKLTKLVYVADRAHMEAHDYPICGDALVSMPYGPVNSVTYSYVSGQMYSHCDWEAFVSDQANHEVGVARPGISDSDLDELSRSELRTLHEVWATFGKMDKWDLVQWTHDNCPEWEDPHGSSNPIPYERVFKFLGKSNAEELEERVIEDRKLRMAFAPN
jgi:uncharacterized phage-associated protein